MCLVEMYLFVRSPQQTVSSHLMLSRMQVFTFSWEKESIGSQMEVYGGLAVYIWQIVSVPGYGSFVVKWTSLHGSNSFDKVYKISHL